MSTLSIAREVKFVTIYLNIRKYTSFGSIAAID